MDLYATHMPMVAAIACKTEGPILEMGCGYYSTYILNAICRVTKRKLITLDEKADWLKEFQHLATSFHQFHFVKDWASFSLIDEIRWDMVLVDHAPGERRIIDIKRLIDNAEYLVVHDTEAECYEYEQVFEKCRYRFDYKLVRPWTTVISNLNDLAFLQA